MTPSVRATMRFTTSPNFFQSSVTTYTPWVVAWRACRPCTDQQGLPLRLSTGSNQREYNGENPCTETYRPPQRPQLKPLSTRTAKKLPLSKRTVTKADGSSHRHATCSGAIPASRFTSSPASRKAADIVTRTDRVACRETLSAGFCAQTTDANGSTPSWTAAPSNGGATIDAPNASHLRSKI